MDPQRSGELPGWQEIAAQFAQLDTRTARPADGTVRLDGSAPGAMGQSNGSAIQVDAYEWLRIFDFGGWISAGPAGGNLHGGP